MLVTKFISDRADLISSGGCGVCVCNCTRLHPPGYGPESGIQYQTQLPVAHPVLNPIDQMWSQIKQYVRAHNKEFTMASIRRLADEKMANQGSQEWGHAFNHMHKYAVVQWLADEQILEEE